jgi:hypothetical protein
VLWECKNFAFLVKLKGVLKNSLFKKKFYVGIEMVELIEIRTGGERSEPI